MNINTLKAKLNSTSIASASIDAKEAPQVEVVEKTTNAPKVRFYKNPKFIKGMKVTGQVALGLGVVVGAAYAGRYVASLFAPAAAAAADAAVEVAGAAVEVAVDTAA